MNRVLLCEICGMPLDDEKAWQLGIDGEGAHFDCLESISWEAQEEEDDDDE